MNKYLTFKVEDFEPLMIAINGGLTVGVVTVAMEKAINAALVMAAQTNWMKVVHPVDLPAGEAVTNVTIA